MTLPLSCVGDSILLWTLGHASGWEAGPSWLDHALCLGQSLSHELLPRVRQVSGVLKPALHELH